MLKRLEVLSRGYSIAETLQLVIRDEQQVAESYDRRWHSHGSLIHGFDQGILRHQLPNEETAAELVRTINENIRSFLRDKSHKMTINLDDIQTEFPEFARRINATGNIEQSLNLFGERHNATAKNASKQSKQSHLRQCSSGPDLCPPCAWGSG